MSPPEGKVKAGETTAAPLCAKGCGFFGNPATRSLCSKCYAQWLLDKVMKGASAGAIADDDGPSSKSKSPPVDDVDEDTGRRPCCGAEEMKADRGKAPPRRARRRCVDGCKRKVGLLGFECRCGGTFCGTHRLPEQHGCAFDYRSAGREEVARANPLVRAAKLRKI